MTAMTGYLQKVAFMQLSQLEKAVLTSLTLFEVSSMILRLAISLVTLLTMLSLRVPHVPPWRLLAMATSIEGILFEAVFGVSL